MGTRVSQLAKISRPQVHEVLLRDRLFMRFDQARRHPIVWISAPPGAGKTTAVVTYLLTRKIGGLWYQVDGDDADPATFCYFLGLVERQLKSRKPSLPLLTPEYLADLPRYSRRLFQELFARMPGGQALVLDNFQEVAEDSRFHDVIEAGLEQIPDGLSVFIISRVDPPERYSRLVANRLIATVDWETMKLTLDETRGIVRQSAPSATSDAIRFHEASGRWCAGLILLLESAGQGKTPGSGSDTNALQGIFGYFASQLFNRLAPGQRDDLVRLAFLPRITISSAREITGDAEVSKLLEWLYRRHLFTDRRENTVANESRKSPDVHTYQFHALFQAFLKQQAQDLLGPQQIASLQRKSAEILQRSAQTESAFELYAEAEDWASARALVLSTAEKLLGEGRWKTLVGWIERLPSANNRDDPWLLHWLGSAKIASSPAAARAILETAYAVSERNGERLCAVLTAACIVETHVLEYTDLRACDRWLPVLAEAFRGFIDFASPESEARALAAFLNALLFRNPGHPNIERFVDRALALFDSDITADLRTTLSVPLNYWGTNCGHLEVATHVISTLEPVIEKYEVSALRKALFYYGALHYYTFLATDTSKALPILKRMRAIAADTGFTFIDGWAAHCAGALPARVRDMDGVAQWLKVMDQSMADRAYDRSMRAMFAALWSGMVAGNPRIAREEALRSMQLNDQVGIIPHQFFIVNALLWAASETCNQEELHRWTVYSKQLMNSTRIRQYEPSILAAQAKTYFALGDRERGEPALRAIMQWARNGSRGICAAAFIVGWMRDLCEYALEWGIEVEYARQVIRENHYLPSREAANWPWPVRILTLGEFSVELDGQPLRHSRKSPKRLLLLLKALVAQGAQEVPVEQLIDALWSDSEADAAHGALAIAIRRLRELLGHDDAILLKGGRLSLNRKICWVDALAFETLLQSDERASIQSALALYRGPFLRDDTAAAWAFSRRDHLHEKFVHHLNRVAKELEAAQDWEGAERWYLRGLDLDDMAESFYQGLLRCHVARGKRPEARRVYDRMSRRLMDRLGMKPSAATTALYQALLAD